MKSSAVLLMAVAAVACSSCAWSAVITSSDCTALAVSGDAAATAACASMVGLAGLCADWTDNYFALEPNCATIFDASAVTGAGDTLTAITNAVKQLAGLANVVLDAVCSNIGNNDSGLDCPGLTGLSTALTGLVAVSPADLVSQVTSASSAMSSAVWPSDSQVGSALQDLIASAQVLLDQLSADSDSASQAHANTLRAAISVAQQFVDSVSSSNTRRLAASGGGLGALQDLLDATIASQSLFCDPSTLLVNQRCLNENATLSPGPRAIQLNAFQATNVRGGNFANIVQTPESLGGQESVWVKDNPGGNSTNDRKALLNWRVPFSARQRFLDTEQQGNPATAWLYVRVGTCLLYGSPEYVANGGGPVAGTNGFTTLDVLEVDPSAWSPTSVTWDTQPTPIGAALGMMYPGVSSSCVAANNANFGPSGCTDVNCAYDTDWMWLDVTPWFRQHMQLGSTWLSLELAMNASQRNTGSDGGDFQFWGVQSDNPPHLLLNLDRQSPVSRAKLRHDCTDGDYASDLSPWCVPRRHD